MKIVSSLFSRLLRRERKLVFVVLVGIALRYAYVFCCIDISKDFYWEYGEIAKNLHAGKGYSLFYLNRTESAFMFNEASAPCPSAFMPPGYVMFLWPFLNITDVPLRNVLILSVQIVAAALVLVLLYLFTERFVRQGAGLFAAGIAAVLPEFVYSTSSYTPTVFFHLGIMGLLSLLHSGNQLRAPRTIVLVGFVSVVLLYLRSEVVLFVAASVFLVGRVAGARAGIMVAGLVVLLHLPWEIRNYTVFGEWVPLTTSGGMNFFRGHNEEGSTAWSDEAIGRQAARLPFDRHYEVEMNNLFFQGSFQYIRDHTLQDFVHAGQKLLRFWIITPEDRRSGAALYVVPWLILLTLGIVGMVRLRAWASHRPEWIFLLCYTIVAVSFFVLPRYQTMMKVAIIPFAGSAVFSLLPAEWRRHFTDR